MTRIRFLLDDATPCRTQQAVLSVFAQYLEESTLGKVVRASQLREIRQWTDVSAESSRRLDLRLQALHPEPDQLTVFLPSHIIPGNIALATPWGATLATREFSTVADLDLFTVDNRSSEVGRFKAFSSSSPDYEAVSRYADFSSRDLPDWLISGGLTSALQLTQRPWYCAFASTRLQWLDWVSRAVKRSLLDLSMVEEDVRTGQARPSLLADVQAILQETYLHRLPDLTFDASFIAPEHRLTDTQHQLLHSIELQKRTVQYHRRNSRQKLAKQGLLKYMRRSLRQFLRLGFQATDVVNSSTPRPAFKRPHRESESRE